VQFEPLSDLGQTRGVVVLADRFLDEGQDLFLPFRQDQAKAPLEDIRMIIEQKAKLKRNSTLLKSNK
jgi:hypothetical protein